MKPTIKTFAGIAVALLYGALLTGPVAANPARDAIIKSFATDAGVSFSAERGKALYESKPGGGKVATPACTTCHGASPAMTGKTRAGKSIKPMAVSKSPARFTVPKKVSKWFRRNCKSVLGRECTDQEKGDFLTYMTSQ